MTEDWCLAPSLAQIGKQLARTTPGRAMAPSGAPVFRHGSAASDDLHAVLEQAPQITRVAGHSKGSLAIANALRSLPSERTEVLSVLTSAVWSRKSWSIAITPSI